MSMFYHCPICYDGEDLCKCTAEDYQRHEDPLKEEHGAQREVEREMYHTLLNISFDMMPTFESSFPLYFAKEILKRLTRSQWIELRKSFDLFFQI